MATPERDAVSARDYVAGRLSDTDREALEERLSSDAGLVQELEQALRLREGLEVLREQEVLGEMWRPQRRSFEKVWTSAAAAAIAIVAVSAALYYGKRSPPIVSPSVAMLRGTSSAPLAVVRRYSFAEMRAAISSTQLSLPASGALELRALTPVTDASRAFRVTLSRIRSQNTSRIGEAEHVVPDADGFVVIYADASRLEPGDYSLSVEPEDEHQPSGERFSFGLNRAGH
jgi:anti-sigma-K factor RskA